MGDVEETQGVDIHLLTKCDPTSLQPITEQCSMLNLSQVSSNDGQH
jgi:hypothetical protein